MKKKLIYGIILVTLLTALWVAPVQAENVETRFIYYGPWVWADPDGNGPRPYRWSWPSEDTLDVLDLRSNYELDNNLQGMGLWVTSAPLGLGYVLISADWEDFVLSNIIVSMEKRWGIDLEAYTSRGIIWEMFVTHGDPTGQSRWKPLTPKIDGTLVIHLEGYSPVTFWEDEPFDGTKKEYRQQVKADKKKNRCIVKEAKKAERKAKREARKAERQAKKKNKCKCE